jgi:hypothetical protein
MTTKKPRDCYWIMFSQRTTVATSMSPQLTHDGKSYFLKAKSRLSAQHVGYAFVAHPKRIEVYTIPGRFVGVATSRPEAAAMIDDYHRKNNRADYWMWNSTPFWNGGKIARPKPAKRNAKKEAGK